MRNSKEIQAEIDAEIAAGEKRLKELRPILRAAKPTYGRRRGRPTKAEQAASGHRLTRDEWARLWSRDHPWGGKRPGTGSKPRARKCVRMFVSLSLENALALEQMPRGMRSKYVNQAIGMLLMMKTPEMVQKPPPRGRHAHKPEGWKQSRRFRMTPLEAIRDKLRLAEEILAEEKSMRPTAYHAVPQP